MKELKKRCRGLFVLLLAATFFLQGGWFMPSDAVSGDNDYLIILQSSVTTESEINNVEMIPIESVPDAGAIKCHSARSYGVYKGSAGAIKSLIDNKKIGTGEGQRLDLENVTGVTKLTNLKAIESNITNPNGETVYVMYNNYSSGADCNLVPEGTYLPYTENSTIERYSDEQNTGYSFRRIDNVSKVESANMTITSTDGHNYYDFNDENEAAWKTIPSDGVSLDILTNTLGPQAIANQTHTSLAYNLVFKIAEKTVYCTADDVNVNYDGKPHTITVNVKEPSADQVKIKYGTSADKCDQDAAPTFTEPGEYTVYYEASAPDTDYATYKGSAKVVIAKNAFTITYDLNGGKLDGQTGTITNTVAAGTVITLPKPTRKGYKFKYWEGSKYNAGDKYTVTGDHTFKAVWAKSGAGSSSNKGVKTGDENNLYVWITLVTAAMAGLVVMALKRKEQ